MAAKIEMEFPNMLCIMVRDALLQATESINFGLYSNIMEVREPSYMRHAAGNTEVQFAIVKPTQKEIFKSVY
jgi:hypothetical protein